jgi:pimeloyl-ACP methyl ester carboxylesterase
MDSLRTPDECFRGLPGFPFQPHYIGDLARYEGLRIHYLDEGPPDATEVFLCLHGQPTWCYLYRKMIPLFTAAGGRAVAPDLAGFGRSDKPVAEAAYTFSFHRELLRRFIERLDLRGITLVCQDWGGILGLTLPMDMPERFRRLIVMNTALATGEPAGKGFEAWKAYNASQHDLAIGALMQRAVKGISAEEAAAYDAPFPDARYKAGVRRFPELVMVRPDMEGAALSLRAREWWLSEWRGRSFMAIGMQDPVLGPESMYALQRHIRGCPPPLELLDAGHFVQEHGEAVAKAALAAFAATPAP